jgi:hypothetical protein
MGDEYTIDIKEEEVVEDSALINEDVNTEPVVDFPDFVLRKNDSEIDPLHNDEFRIVQFDDIGPLSEQPNLVTNTLPIPTIVSFYSNKSMLHLNNYFVVMSYIISKLVRLGGSVVECPPVTLRTAVQYRVPPCGFYKSLVLGLECMFVE